jgi:hypothetical protein
LKALLSHSDSHHLHQFAPVPHQFTAAAKS